MAAVHVNDQSFDQQVLHGDQPVLVDFWAPWCGPCRAMSGVVDEVATEVAGRATVVKANVDESHEVAQRYGIQSIPAFVLFRDGKVESQFAGVVPKDRLIDAIDASRN